jgi:hypothetical protein
MTIDGTPSSSRARPASCVSVTSPRIFIGSKLDQDSSDASPSRKCSLRPAWEEFDEEARGPLLLRSLLGHSRQTLASGAAVTPGRVALFPRRSCFTFFAKDGLSSQGGGDVLESALRRPVIVNHFTPRSWRRPGWSCLINLR